jgi:putative NIF3 family GTP cyclohydrolase 1 type 2
MEKALLRLAPVFPAHTAVDDHHRLGATEQAADLVL